MGFTSLFSLLLVVVTGTLAEHAFDNTTTHLDAYIEANRRHHNAILQDYENRMEMFETNYNESLKTIDIQLEFLVNAIRENEEALNTLELLNELNKECVNKYKPSLPEEEVTKALVQSCSYSAYKRLPSLEEDLMETRMNLKDYYARTFETDVTLCDNETCVNNVVSKANSFTATNQKTFATQMDTATCLGKGSLKTALDCSFTAQSNALSLLASTKTLIDRCSQKADCKPGGYCEHVEKISSHMVNYTKPMVDNPFYGKNETSSCLLWQIY
ncbi:uncharacterized protein LOC106093046 [Stomoxys calcitrans]|uniref:uncharacterized protein LOC106093046 n=1 Tax=Stomoxys calcitrans TaxID=35570 RepID=UPI0027E2DBA4|nr:uncharacterized protein LOC106093046 [Stomoxys calcitrans]